MTDPTAARPADEASADDAAADAADAARDAQTRPAPDPDAPTVDEAEPIDAENHIPNPVLDEGYDPAADARVMGLTPEPVTDEPARDGAGDPARREEPQDLPETEFTEEVDTARAMVPAGPYGPGSAEPDELGAPPEGFPVKGDAASMRFSHPGSARNGELTPTVWFASADDAESAGFTDIDHEGS